ncbi:MAG: 16S rRNA (guanine(966)-N(2))-methyltransferase RsmD [Burkholderiales bacterium]|nr:16S rRNA (guanine(966)-N(2))-methyltransferase RsmD [Burkholderiales bacterium]
MATGEVRIVGGRWRRSKLPVAERAGLRPTPDRVRETLFNWLGQDLTGWRVLDAFAGSGALGFEAASRGAAEVVLLEREPALCRSLEASRLRLGGDTMRIECGDALTWMARAAHAAFDLVLLDPPFGSGLLATAVAAALPLATPGGWLYVESGEPLAELPDGLASHRRLTAGAVHAQLLRRLD